MFADVWPLLRLPRHLAVYTYRIPPELDALIHPGMLVRIPWRGRQIDGIVRRISHTTPWPKTTDLVGATLPQPIWDEARLLLAEGYAREIFASPATLSYVLLPEIPKRARVIPAEIQAIGLPEFRPHTTLRKEQIDALKAVATTRESFSGVQTRRFADRVFLYRHWIAESSGGVLIQAAQMIDALELAQALEQAFPGEVIVWGIKENPGKRWRRFQDIASGRCRIVIGTRSAVFLPVPRLSRIIIDQEERQEHRSWEQSPYFDASSLSRRLASALAIPCCATTLEPPIERLATSGYAKLPDHAAPAETFIHNSGKALLHDDIVDRLQDCLNQGKHALIVASKKSASRLLCCDCTQAWLCPVCQNPLRVFSDVLTCPQCFHDEPIPNRCPQCGGVRFITPAPGLLSLQKNLRTLFSVPVLACTSDDDTPALPTDTPAIVVSTPHTWRRMLAEPKPAIGFALLFHPESVLYQPDYRANERYRQYIQWHRSAIYDYLRLPLVIQSSLPESHGSHSQALLGLSEAEQKQELETRKQLRLPPFGHTVLIRLEDSQETPPLDSIGFTSVVGPQRHRASGEKRWVIRVGTDEITKLDKLNDSVYSKAIIHLDPEEATLL